jgi:predicted DNA-binding transcriptional regulator AlpA
MHPRQYQLMCAGQRDPDWIAHSVPSTPRSSTEIRARGPPIEDEDILLTSAQTRARIGNVSAMCVWRRMRDARVRFPQPVKINSRNYWRLGDLRRWQAERTAVERA